MGAPGLLLTHGTQQHAIDECVMRLSKPHDLHLSFGGNPLCAPGPTPASCLLPFACRNNLTGTIPELWAHPTSRWGDQTITYLMHNSLAGPVPRVSNVKTLCSAVLPFAVMLCRTVPCFALSRSHWALRMPAINSHQLMLPVSPWPIPLPAGTHYCCTLTHLPGLLCS